MLAILLLDENTSPRIVRLLWEQDVDAVHIRDRGLLGAADHELWRLARAEARTIVTINARDFLRLARDSDRHPGIIVIPSGGSPEAQLRFIMAAVRWATTSANVPNGFSDRYLVVGDRSEIALAEIVIREKGDDSESSS